MEFLIYTIKQASSNDNLKKYNNACTYIGNLSELQFEKKLCESPIVLCASSPNCGCRKNEY